MGAEREAGRRGLEGGGSGWEEESQWGMVVWTCLADNGAGACRGLEGRRGGGRGHLHSGHTETRSHAHPLDIKRREYRTCGGCNPTCEEGLRGVCEGTVADGPSPAMEARELEILLLAEALIILYLCSTALHISSMV